MLYEMYAGRRAFSGRTAVETMSAILKEDPPELGPIKGVSPAVERVMRRCLEKNRLERFQSARDVNFALDALSTATSAAHEVVAAPAMDRRVRLPVAIALVVVAGALAAAATYAAVRRLAPPPVQPAIKQLTFRSGTVRGARFAPDGKSVIYGAAWEGRPIELYAVREQSPESSVVSLPPADLLAISTTGELAVALSSRRQRPVHRLRHTRAGTDGRRRSARTARERRRGRLEFRRLAARRCASLQQPAEHAARVSDRDRPLLGAVLDF
jgi:eukaryotic-like serine/threonine-protein kinase